EVWLTYLDVGRGLAVIIRTAQHTLVYDTGPGFNSGFDAGEAVIIPTLRAAGINKIDTLIISSANNNHIGGARVVLKQMSVTQVITSVPLFFQPGLARVCQANEYWEWDKISFRILDADCRLQIDNSMTIEGDMKVATAQEGTIIYRLSPGKEPV